MRGYWFSSLDGTTAYQRNAIKVGDTLTVAGTIEPCVNGLHFSPTPWDALGYASGPLMWEVSGTGKTIPHGNPVDKYAARKRKHLRCVDLTPVMRQFAAKQALGVMHLWDAPLIVQEFLRDVSEGKNPEDIRAAARAAARDAARAAAWAAAWAAARDAAWAAARDAARDAAWAAARDAAWAAARDAAKEQFNQMAIAALEASK